MPIKGLERKIHSNFHVFSLTTDPILPHIKSPYLNFCNFDIQILPLLKGWKYRTVFWGKLFLNPRNSREMNLISFSCLPLTRFIEKYRPYKFCQSLLQKISNWHLCLFMRILSRNIIRIQNPKSVNTKFNCYSVFTIC